MGVTKEQIETAYKDLWSTVEDEQTSTEVILYAYREALEALKVCKECVESMRSGDAVNDVLAQRITHAADVVLEKSPEGTR